MTETETEQDEREAIIKKVAATVAKDFPGVDREDLEQDLWVFILENELNPDDAGALRALYKQAKMKAWDFRKWQLAQSDQYDYTRHDVVALLRSVFTPEDWEEAWVPDDARSDLPWFDSVELSCDVSRAIEQLSDTDQFKLRSAFYYGNDNVKGLTKAIDHVVEKLNGVK